jgi:F-type H+-transporting ATPase subunit c
MLSYYVLHFLASAVSVGIGAIGIGIGQGIAIGGMLEAYDRQSKAASEISKALFVGIFLMEGCFILAFIVSITILLTPFHQVTEMSGLVEFFVGLASGVATSLVGVACGYAIKGACLAIARQPFYAQRVQMFLLIILAFIETPAIFCFILAMAIFGSFTPDMSFVEAIKYSSAAISVCLGSVGPSVAQALFAKAACEAVGLNHDAFTKIFSFTVITEALIETAALFCFIVGFTILGKKISPDLTESGSISFMIIPFTVGIGTIGSAIGIGMVGMKAVKEIAIHPKEYGLFFGTTFFFQVLIEISGLFAFLISILLLFKMSF